MHKLLFPLIFILFSASISAQSFRKGNYNRLGLQARYALVNIETDDFNMEADSGILAGLTTRGAFYKNFDLIYGIDFLSASLRAKGAMPGQETEDIQYKVIGAQLNFLASYLIAGDNLSVEFGPVFMVNGKLELDDARQENHVLDGYSSLRAADIQEINRFNMNLAGGISFGFPKIKGTIQYQYGLLNTLNRLNDEVVDNVDLNAHDFKGNISMLSGGIVLYL